MQRFFIPFVLLLTTACMPQDTSGVSTRTSNAGSSNADISGASCQGRSQGNCAFINGPVRLGTKQINLPGRKFPFFETVENLDFVDAVSQNWAAPASTLTDGASIPPVFVQVIGDPKSREFINAATIHDAYCGVGNEDGTFFQAAPWPKVHRMFYDALRVGGTPKIKAKIMYAAVYMGGPRWDGANRPQVSRSAISISSKSVPNPSNKNLLQRGIPASVMVAEMARVKSYIETNDPPIADLERHLRTRESGIAKSLTTTRVVQEEPERGGDGDGGGH